MPNTPIDFSNPQFGAQDFASAGNPGAANPNLGKRDQTGLQAAFTTSPLLNGEYQEYDQAAAVFETYTGENTDFPMYRRNFHPTGDSRPEYQDGRSKTMTTEQLESTKLGTPYSPTVMSPGAGNGFEYSALHSVPGLRPAAVGPDSNVDPNAAKYQNVDSSGHIDDAGRVRFFKLGVGSTVGDNRVNPPRT